jgi:hypothetical protein
MKVRGIVLSIAVAPSSLGLQASESIVTGDVAGSVDASRAVAAKAKFTNLPHPQDLSHNRLKSPIHIRRANSRTNFHTRRGFQFQGTQSLIARAMPDRS